MPSYPIPAQAIEVELEVKKSRFITRVAYVADRDAAMQMLQQARVDYPDARHHCWAYRLGPPHSPYSAAMSDDGEPSGTAGKPILNVLEHKTIGDIMVVVIRYFGGIKLGAGGLVRAYSGAAQQAIEQLPLQEQVAKLAVTVKLDFAQEQPVRHWLSVNQGDVEQVDYAQQVTMQLSITQESQAQWTAFAASYGLEFNIDSDNS